jgi:hypothetical protein
LNISLSHFFRVEKDKSQIIAEVADVRAATDEVGRSKVTTLYKSENNNIGNHYRLLQKNHIKLWLLL